VRVESATGLAPRVIPVYGQATATEGAEGTDYAGTAKFDKSTAATITPKIAKTQYKFTRARYATDPDTVRNDAANEMGGAIATKVDGDLVGLFSSFSTDKGTAGSALTLRRVGASMALLRNRNVMGQVNVVLHPYGWHDIWVELGQPGANQALLGDVANEALREYYVMRHLGANWFTDGNIDVDSSDDAISGVFVRDALMFDSRQQPIMLTEFDASVYGGGAEELNMEIWYGVGVPRSTYGVKLTHDATEPTG
jgi:hypothetical protein